MKNNKLDKVLQQFAKAEGIAVLSDDITGSMIRWIGAGCLSTEQLKKLTNLYNNYKNENN